MKQTQPIRVRVGVFELDLTSGELRNNGNRTVLQEQPLQILRMLVEREGELVSREEIRKKLWPNDTIVEFDHSINAAIKNLRRALDDSADEPRYIETLARRGYRLMVPVEWVREDHSSGQASAVVERQAVKLQAEPGLVGKKVSHYRVLQVIGAGGMGLVYKAEDLKLGRQVALKFLPAELVTNPAALQRFEREAQTASSLNHPNICTIYEVEEHEAAPFIVMELLEGETLRDRLARGVSRDKALPPHQLLDIGVQVCAGLQAAHEKGIIHRDIKPANIFLTDSGQVKILDFGIAKLVVEAPESGTVEAPESAAVEAPDFSPATRREKEMGLQPRPEEGAEPGLKPSSRDSLIRRAEARLFHPAATPGETTLTRTGAALGTAGYMSPEQVRGEKLDARTDLFSFGLVLYEMATGQRAFSGETQAMLHNAILNTSPVPVQNLNSILPPKLERIIDKALQKDRERRYQSAAELRADLKTAQDELRPPVSDRAPRRARKKLASIVVAILLIGAVGLVLLSRFHAAPKLTAKDTILVADLDNSSGDPLFDDGLKTALDVYLDQSPFINLLSDRKLNAALKLMNHPANVRLPAAEAREVCVRTNSRALVAGSISDVGNRYRVDLRATDCRTGTTIARSQAEADDRDKVIAALGQAGADLRAKLGEPRASQRGFSTPPEQALTSSLEALHAFDQSLRIPEERRLIDSIPLLQRAVELDPNFAKAFEYLGAAYHNTGSDVLATECWKKAYALRDRLSQRQRFFTEGLYYFAVTGELEKYAENLKLSMQAYPTLRDNEWQHTDLSMTYYSLGRHDQALAEAREQVRTNPTSYVSYMGMIRVYLALGRLDDAKAAADEARARNVDGPELQLADYVLAFSQGDNEGMKEQLIWAKGKRGVENSLLSAASDTEAYFGRFAKARELTEQAVVSAQSANELEAAAAWKGQAALREAEVGNQQRARQLAAQSLSLSDPFDLKALAALTLAAAEHPAQAQELADQIGHERPLDTLVQYYWLPMIRAGIELDRNAPQNAIQKLAIASRYEMGSPGIKQEPFANLYPVYVRGKAYLQAGQAQPAAAEFQKILDHHGLVSNFIIGALAHVQLARAQAMMGDKVAARKSYQEFLTLWKDADPDIPIYKQAKAEYAKLK